MFSLHHGAASKANVGLGKSLSKPVIRPATAADIAKFYKGTYRLTATAMVGTVRGRIGACWGISHVDGRLVLFCDVRPWARRYKLAIVKNAIAFVNTVKASGAKFIWTEADPNEPGAVRWILSLGFKPTRMPRMYRWAKE